MSLKKPSELFEQRRLQSLVEETVKKEEGEVKNKNFDVLLERRKK